MSQADHIEGLPYPVLLGGGALAQLPDILAARQLGRSVILVEDSVRALHSAKIEAAFPDLSRVRVVAGGEASKDLEFVRALWTLFADWRIDRSTAIIVIGGGALCDAASFAAATFMRGCPTVLLPTTLLAQVDAGIGGKTGINFAGAKNLIGSTTAPRAVLIDLDFLSSLPERQFRSGLAEMVKHALIADAQHFRALYAVTLSPADRFTKLMCRSLEIKASIVAQDPYESGLRKVLNFGHTVGHAIEALALDQGRDITHGEAVALGIVAESWLSVSRGWLSREDLQDIERALASVKLPTRLPFSLTIAELHEKMLLDKKSREGRLQFTLLKTLGQAVYDCEVPRSDLHSSLGYLSANQ